MPPVLLIHRVCKLAKDRDTTTGCPSSGSLLSVAQYHLSVFISISDRLKFIKVRVVVRAHVFGQEALLDEHFTTLNTCVSGHSLVVRVDVQS